MHSFFYYYYLGPSFFAVRQIRAAIQELKPDIILLTGDCLAVMFPCRVLVETNYALHSYYRIPVTLNMCAIIRVD